MKQITFISLFFIYIHANSQGSLNQTKAYIIKLNQDCRVSENTDSTIIFVCDNILSFFTFDKIGLCDYQVNVVPAFQEGFVLALGSFIESGWSLGRRDTILCKKNLTPMIVQWFYNNSGVTASVSNLDAIYCRTGWITINYIRN